MYSQSDCYILINNHGKYDWRLFSKACNSSDIFDSLAISDYSDYQVHLNQYNVIYIDFSDMDDACTDYPSFIGRIKKRLKRDLFEAYPDIIFDEASTITEDLVYKTFH